YLETQSSPEISKSYLREEEGREDGKGRKLSGRYAASPTNLYQSSTKIRASRILRQLPEKYGRSRLRDVEDVLLPLNHSRNRHEHIRTKNLTYVYDLYRYMDLGCNG
ncbi:uncharacterized protein METZ01_LOCUS516705, partial [marine metagenome]